jgi:peptide-methionine (S)-S-oxide reductase
VWRKAVWAIPVVLVAGFVVAPFFRAGHTVPEHFPAPESAEPTERAAAEPGRTEVATFGSGCFWCTEAVFSQMKGVKKVVSGYSGGAVKDPTYEQVCTGATGHAEVVQVTFDPAAVSYPELLEVFWRSHDPTTRNRQGHDVGTQYRSVIFTHSERQRELAIGYKGKIDAAEVFASPLVTEIEPFTAFSPAEDYHQSYYANNSRRPYCRNVIRPKLDELRRVFRDKLKGE